MKSKLILALIFVALIAFTSTKFYTLQEQKKTIAFVDDFNENSSLEPDYYLYFKNISQDSLLGRYNYERHNVNIDLRDNNDDKSLDLNHANVVVLLLGTANSVINTLDTSNEINPDQFREEYINLVNELLDQGKKVVIVSPPPYKTISKYEDEVIINNRNALEKLARGNKKSHYVDLYSFLNENYIDKKISPSELSESMVKLILKKDSKIRQK